MDCQSCLNADREILGLDRIAEALAECAVHPPNEIISHLLKQAEVWAGSEPQEDDLTLIVLKVEG